VKKAALLLALFLLAVLRGDPALAQDPEDQLLRGGEWEARNDTAHAAEAYERVLKLLPGDEFALCRLGLLDFQARRLVEAKARFEAVLAANPGNILARSMHGFLLLREGKLADAEMDFAAALAADPASALSGLGMAAVRLTQGKEAEALTLLGTARPAAGDDLVTLAVWRDMARGLGLPMNARLAEDGLLEMAPRDPAVLTELGWSLLSLGEGELARNAWTQALRLAPGDAAARSALASSLRTEADAAAAAGDEKRAARLLRDAEDAERGRGFAPARY